MKALEYLGGKTTTNPMYAGRHIARLLPHKHIYIEPYAGMLGMLLNRAPSQVEIVNDLDKRIVNWWRTLRDHPAELTDMLRLTPWARDEYKYQLTMLDDPDPLKSALAVSVVLMQSLHKALNTGPGDWGRSLSLSLNSRWLELPDKLLQVAKRVSNIQIENTPALRLLERVSELEDCVIYCDPPYATANTVFRYGVNQQDKAKTAEVLQTCKGFVAISGYGDEWDILKWRRIEIPTITRIANTKNTDGEVQRRVEVVWINQPTNQLHLFN